MNLMVLTASLCIGAVFHYMFNTSELEILSMVVIKKMNMLIEIASIMHHGCYFGASIIY